MIIASRAVSPCSSGLPPNPTVGPHGSISQLVPPATTAFTAVPSPSLRTRQATSLTETHVHKHMINVQFTMQQVRVFEHNTPNLTSRTSLRNFKKQCYVNILVIFTRRKIQKRATKLVINLKKIPYKDRLMHLKLPTLKYRRLCGDMIEVFKIIYNNIYDPEVSPKLRY